MAPASPTPFPVYVGNTPQNMPRNPESIDGCRLDSLQHKVGVECVPGRYQDKLGECIVLPVLITALASTAIKITPDAQQEFIAQA